MPNANAGTSPASRTSGTPASISQPGVYQDIATWRRQQTLSPRQLDPVKNSAARRKLYRTGKNGK